MKKRQPGRVRDKKCKYCGEIRPMVGKQTVCRACTREVHKEACHNWWKRQKENPVKRPEMQGLTFEFKAGKWYWQAANGLTNGPFESLKAARRDANKAL